MGIPEGIGNEFPGVYGFIDPLEFYIDRLFIEQGEKDFLAPKKWEESHALCLLKLFSGQSGLIILPEKTIPIEKANLIRHIRATLDPNSEWGREGDEPNGWDTQLNTDYLRAADKLRRCLSVSLAQRNLYMAHRESPLFEGMNYEIEVRHVTANGIDMVPDFLVAESKNYGSMYSNFNKGLSELVDFYLDWGYTFKSLDLEDQMRYMRLYPHAQKIAQKYGFVDIDGNADFVRLEDFVLPWLSTVVNQTPQQRNYNQYYGRGRDDIVDTFRQRKAESEALYSVLKELHEQRKGGATFEELKEVIAVQHPDFKYNYQWLAAMLTSVQGMALSTGLACNDGEGEESTYTISRNKQVCNGCFHRNLCLEGLPISYERRKKMMAELFNGLASSLKSNDELQGHDRVLVLL